MDGINLENILDKSILNAWYNADISFIKNIIKKSLTPKNKLDIVDFIERNRILNERVTDFAGMYSFTLTPYLREIIRCLDENSSIQYIDFMKGAQIGATVGLDENLMIYLLVNAPAPVLFLASTSEVAEQIFTTRITPSIEESGFSDYIKSASKNRKSRETGNTKSLKTFDGGFFQIGGLQSISKLKSFSVKVLIVTEVDEAKVDVAGQGGAISLAERRTDAFSMNKKILMESTPKKSYDESVIYRRFLDGDQRYYHVPCKNCKELQVLDFKQLKYKLDIDGSLDTSSIYYECIYCGSHWKEVDKQYFLKSEEDGGLAKWIPKSKAKDPRRRSYHLSSLYAPLGFRSWESIIYDYIKALKNIENGDDGDMKVFANTVLGLPYQALEEAPPYKLVYDKNRGNYLSEKIDEYGNITQSTLNIDELKYKPLYCNIAVDVQGKYLEAGVFLWCEGYRVYMLGYHRFDGDTSNLQNRCWRLLDKLIKSEHLGFYASIVFIDKGYIPAVVSDFCENLYMQSKILGGGIVFAIKGDNTGVLFKKQQTNENTENSAIIINSSMAKDKAYYSLSLELNEDGSIPPNWAYFPSDLSVDFFRMLTAEEKVKKYQLSGVDKFEWRLRAGQKRNEALDIFGYSITASNFYIQALAPRNSKNEILYSDAWNYLKSSAGVEYEKLNKFETAKKLMNER